MATPCETGGEPHSLRDRRGASDPVPLLELVRARTPGAPRMTVRALSTGRGRRSHSRGRCLKRTAATLSPRISCGRNYPGGPTAAGGWPPEWRSHKRARRAHESGSDALLSDPDLGDAPVSRPGTGSLRDRQVAVATGQPCRRPSSTVPEGDARADCRRGSTPQPWGPRSLEQPRSPAGVASAFRPARLRTRTSARPLVAELGAPSRVLGPRTHGYSRVRSDAPHLRDPGRRLVERQEARDVSSDTR